MELGFSLLRLANEEEEDDFKVPESIKDANEVSGMSDFFSPLAFMIVVFVTPRNCDFAVPFRFVLCTFCKPFWRSIAMQQFRKEISCISRIPIYLKANLLTYIKMILIWGSSCRFASCYRRSAHKNPSKHHLTGRIGRKPDSMKSNRS
jgi:hypothetical protein